MEKCVQTLAVLKVEHKLKDVGQSQILPEVPIGRKGSEVFDHIRQFLLEGFDPQSGAGPPDHPGDFFR